MLGDLLVHLRLGEARLIAFIVAPAAVADQIDQHILAIALAERKRQPGGGEAGFRLISIDMDDRDLESLGRIAGIESAARIPRIRREANLVVYDDMHRAAGGVALQP